MPASLWFCTGFGTFYGGVVTAFADTAINTAVTTTLPPGTSFGTLDLKVNFLRPVTPDSRELVARATVEQRGRTIAVTTCRVDDADGKRVAMATGSAMVSPAGPGPPDRTPELLTFLDDLLGVTASSFRGCWGTGQETLEQRRLSMPSSDERTWDQDRTAVERH